MKRGMNAVAAALACAVLLALTGCSTWTDETGRHFMLFGTRGPSGIVSEEYLDDADGSMDPDGIYDEDAIEATIENAVEGALEGVDNMDFMFDEDDATENGTLPSNEWDAGDDYPAYDDPAALASDKDDGTVSALSYQQGSATGDELILLKGRKVTLTGGITLLEQDLSHARDIEIDTALSLDSGSFKLILVKPDGTIEVLADEHSAHGVTHVKLEQGVNRVRLIGKPAVFGNIRLSVAGNA